MDVVQVPATVTLSQFMDKMPQVPPDLSIPRHIAAQFWMNLNHASPHPMLAKPSTRLAFCLNHLTNDLRFNVSDPQLSYHQPNHSLAKWAMECFEAAFNLNLTPTDFFKDNGPWSEYLCFEIGWTPAPSPPPLSTATKQESKESKAHKKSKKPRPPTPTGAAAPQQPDGRQSPTPSDMMSMGEPESESDKGKADQRQQLRKRLCHAVTFSRFYDCTKYTPEILRAMTQPQLAKVITNTFGFHFDDSETPYKSISIMNISADILVIFHSPAQATAFMRNKAQKLCGTSVSVNYYRFRNKPIPEGQFLRASNEVLQQLGIAAPPSPLRVEAGVQGAGQGKGSGSVGGKSPGRA